MRIDRIRDRFSHKNDPRPTIPADTVAEVIWGLPAHPKYSPALPCETLKCTRRVFGVDSCKEEGCSHRWQREGAEDRAQRAAKDRKGEGECLSRSTHAFTFVLSPSHCPSETLFASTNIMDGVSSPCQGEYRKGIGVSDKSVDIQRIELNITATIFPGSHQNITTLIPNPLTGGAS